LDFIVAMMNVAREFLARARKNAELGRGGSGIDGQYTAQRPIRRVGRFVDGFRSHVRLSSVLEIRLFNGGAFPPISLKERGKGWGTDAVFGCRIN
jgi:hypothetical protein